MKLNILMDNHTEIDVYYLGEPAVSYWIETEGKAFLFDAGYSDAFLKNAKDMGIDVTKAEAVLLSHSHNDHTGGLKPLLELDFAKKPQFIAHPDALLPHDWNGMDIGSPVSAVELSEKFELKLGKEPVWLTKKLVWLGEIPHTLDFEPAYAIGTVEKDGEKQEDYMIDDTALAYVGEKGLSIITGCSHAGILAEEVFYRTGGLAVINPIFFPGFMLNTRPITMTSALERVPGLGKTILTQNHVGEGDLLIIHSVSGRNNVPVEMAMSSR